jgi:hypothetical protein
MRISVPMIIFQSANKCIYFKLEINKAIKKNKIKFGKI